MKTHILASIGLIVSTLVLPAHEFTDLQGRKLDAEIIAAASGQVMLKRATDGRTFNVAANTFSEADQKFISEWADANTKYGFEVSYTKKKLNQTRTKQGAVTLEEETWIYKINIRNRQPTAVGDLRVDYWCFRREDSGKGKGTARIETSGSSKVEMVAGSGRRRWTPRKLYFTNRNSLAATITPTATARFSQTAWVGLWYASSIKKTVRCTSGPPKMTCLQPLWARRSQTARNLPPARNSSRPSLEFQRYAG